MADLAEGAQAKIRDFQSDPDLNGKACVILGTSLNNATVRLPTGRELLVPLESVQLVAQPGKLPEGTRVVLVGLAKAPTLNFKQGSIACCAAPSAGRLNVDLGHGEVKALKYENMVLLDPDTVLDTAAKLGKHARGNIIKICNFIDPGMNGVRAIVLDRDPNDDTRLLVVVQESCKVMGLRPEKMIATQDSAIRADLDGVRPVLKEAFFSEIRKLLWGLPGEQLRLLNVLAPSASSRANPFSMEAKAMTAWAAYRGAYSADEEPLMRSVLKDKSDVFRVLFSVAGEETVALTDAGKELCRSDGLPEPPAKRPRVESDTNKLSKDELARALFAAMELAAPGRTAMHISQLGSDPKFSVLRKDPRFKKLKLTDLVREYPLVFEVTSGTDGSLQVKLRPEAHIALPQRAAGQAAPMGGGDVLPDSDQMRLPDKIESLETLSLAEKLQALRIELIHALFRRDGRAEPTQLGQDAGVRKIKSFFPKSKTLVDLIRVFLDNFSIVVDPSDKKTQVQLDSMDVQDQTCILEFLSKR